MTGPTLALRSRRVVLGDDVLPATLLVADGRIEAVRPHDEPLGGRPVEDLGELVLMPGLVDTHVHVNEPGRTEWEGFDSATRAAAAGGVTTLVDMPLNAIPATTSVQALELKRAAAADACHVDVGFWGGVVPGNAAQLEPLVRAGALGFKCFLVDPGVPEFAHVDESDLARALPILADLDVPLLVHAELPGPIAEAARLAPPPGSPEQRRYATWLASRPRAAEDQAVALLVRLCRRTGARLHVVHHCSADALPLIEAARHDGLRLSAETCPHYLHFAAEDVPDGATAFKCAPPIREAENRERLWQALADGVLDGVVSDHSPCTLQLKQLERGDFEAAWGGISGLQLLLPATWSEARARGHGLPRLVEWLAAAPARLAGLGVRKGSLAPGADADLLAWDPEQCFTVDAAALQHRNPVTPYAGETLFGVVHGTWSRGTRVYGGDADGAPRGRLLGH